MSLLLYGGYAMLVNINYPTFRLFGCFLFQVVQPYLEYNLEKKLRKLHGSVYVLRAQMRAQLDICYLSFISLGSHATHWFDVGPASQMVDQHRTSIG